MGEIDAFDVAVDQAWAGFETRLAAALHELAEDRPHVAVDCGRAFDLEDGAPWIWVEPDDDGDLQLSASRRDDLLPRFRLRRRQRRRLVDLGWPASSLDNHGVPMVSTNVPQLCVAPADAAELAGMIIGLVREIWAVPHPAFLDVDDVLEEAPVEPPFDEVAARPTCGESDALPPAPDVAWPTGRSELVDLVARTLADAPHLGSFDPTERDDAEYLLCDGLVLRVGVPASMPFLELRVCLLNDVDNPKRARLEVNLANRLSGVAHYVSDGSQVFADAVCPGLPFVPEQLRWLIATFIHEVSQTQVPMGERLDATLARYDEGLPDASEPDVMMLPDVTRDEDDGLSPFDGVDPVARVEPADDGVDPLDGVNPVDGTDAIDWSSDQPAPGAGDSCSTELPERLLTLIQLDHDGETSLEPRLVSSVCDHDRGLVLRFMRIVEQEALNWDASAEEARSADDAATAEVCEGEAAAWQRTLAQLRAALRYLVELDLHEEAA
jgi:hypothetical protein